MTKTIHFAATIKHVNLGDYYGWTASSNTYDYDETTGFGTSARSLREAVAEIVTSCLAEVAAQHKHLATGASRPKVARSRSALSTPTAT